jgi:hypothetical protein
MLGDRPLLHGDASLSHGDLVFDPRTDLSQGGGDDAEHPTDITMLRAPLPSDTCGIYFTYIKVNHLLYTCSLDLFEDGILLDSSLVCIHRFERSFTLVEEEFKHKRTTTPSKKEAWKRRRNREEEGHLLQESRTVRPKSDYPTYPPTGHPTYVFGSVHMLVTTSECPTHTPTSRNIRLIVGLSDLPARSHSGRGPCTPSPRLDYIYSSPTSELGLANMIAHLS